MGGRDNPAASIDNAIIMAVASDQNAFLSPHVGGNARRLVIAHASLGMEADRPDLGIRLRGGKRPMGEDQERLAVGNICQAVAAGVSLFVRDMSLGRLTVGVIQSALDSRGHGGRQRMKLLIDHWVCPESERSSRGSRRETETRFYPVFAIKFRDSAGGIIAYILGGWFKI